MHYNIENSGEPVREMLIFCTCNYLVLNVHCIKAGVIIHIYKYKYTEYLPGYKYTWKTSMHTCR